jgi:hypothetical protein
MNADDSVINAEAKEYLKDYLPHMENFKKDESKESMTWTSLRFH